MMTLRLVASGLEGRPEGGSVRPVDLQAPRQPGRLPEQLLVEVVPPTADGLGEGQGGGDAVEVAVVWVTGVVVVVVRWCLVCRSAVPFCC